MVVGAVVIFVVASPWLIPLDRLGAGADLGGWHVPVWTLLVTCAVLSTAVAYLLSTSALRDLPANVVSVLAVCEPVVATVLAWLALGQSLTVAQLAGAAVLLAGATVVQRAARGYGRPSNQGIRHPASPTQI